MHGRCIQHGRQALSYLLVPVYRLQQSPNMAASEPLRKSHRTENIAETVELKHNNLGIHLFFLFFYLSLVLKHNNKYTAGVTIDHK